VGAKVFPSRIVFGVFWLLAVGAGFVVLWNYQNASGRVGVTPQHWPAGTRIALAHDRATLIMFAHPRCPCTQAGIEELNRLLARSQGRVAAQVLFFKPGKAPADWTQTRLRQSAAAIPGVTVHEDLEGAQARLFGAETSGHVLLYDTRGQLLFQGGITGGRGHAGDNAGEQAVVSLLAGQAASLKQTRVFGCSLLENCEISPEGAVR
jgi:hypothetical protein